MMQEVRTSWAKYLSLEVQAELLGLQAAAESVNSSAWAAVLPSFL
jgi:hypothetical protein